jgi:hypothetical protein
MFTLLVEQLLLFFGAGEGVCQAPEVVVSASYIEV